MFWGSVLSVFLLSFFLESEGKANESGCLMAVSLLDNSFPNQRHPTTRYGPGVEVEMVCACPRCSNRSALGVLSSSSNSEIVVHQEKLNNSDAMKVKFSSDAPIARQIRCTTSADCLLGQNFELFESAHFNISTASCSDDDCQAACHGDQHPSSHVCSEDLNLSQTTCKAVEESSLCSFGLKLESNKNRTLMASMFCDGDETPKTECEAAKNGTLAGVVVAFPTADQLNFSCPKFNATNFSDFASTDIVQQHSNQTRIPSSASFQLVRCSVNGKTVEGSNSELEIVPRDWKSWKVKLLCVYNNLEGEMDQNLDFYWYKFFVTSYLFLNDDGCLLLPFPNQTDSKKIKSVTVSCFPKVISFPLPKCKTTPTSQQPDTSSKTIATAHSSVPTNLPSTTDCDPSAPCAVGTSMIPPARVGWMSPIAFGVLTAFLLILIILCGIVVLYIRRRKWHKKNKAAGQEAEPEQTTPENFRRRKD